MRASPGEQIAQVDVEARSGSHREDRSGFRMADAMPIDYRFYVSDKR